MNKKIFGFLLAATALFSVGTFESCKDTNTDLWNEVITKQNNQYSELKKQIDELRSKLCTVDCEAVKNDVEALKTKLAALEKEIAGLKDADKALEDALKAEINAIKLLLEKYVTKEEYQKAIDGINARLDALEAAVKLLEEKKADKADLDKLQKMLEQLEKDYKAADDQLRKDFEAADVLLQKQIDELYSLIADLQWQINNIVVGSYDDSELKARVAALEAQVAELQGLKADLEALRGEVVSLKNYVDVQDANLQSQIDALKKLVENHTHGGNGEPYNDAWIHTALNDINGEINGLKDRVKDLEDRVEKLDARVKKLEDKVNALAKQVLSVTVQSVKNPLYGSFNTPFGITSNVLVAYHTNFDDIKTLFNEDVEAENDNYGGTIYMTVDPANIDFSGLNVSLVNSRGESAGMSLSPLQKSDAVLSMGTRAGSANYLYETTATISNYSALDHVSLDVAALKSAVSDVIHFKNGVNLKSLAELVINTLRENNYDMNAVMVNDNNGNVHLSKYEIAAVAYTPLNLKQFGAIENVAGRVEFEKYLSQLSAVVDGVTINSDGTINFEVPGSPNVTIYDENGNVIKDAEVSSVTTSGFRGAEAFVDIISALLNFASNKLSNIDKIALLANPVCFYLDGKKFGILSQDENNPTLFSSKDIHIFPTSYCVESLVPFFKKALKSSDVTLPNNGEPVDGTRMKNVTGTINTTGTAEIKYGVIDFSGNREIRTYYVKVK